MKRLLLSLILALPALAQQFSPAELQLHVATNLPSGSILTAQRLRDTFTNVITSVLFRTNDLSDLLSASAARSNLGLGALATLTDAPAGTLTGTTLAANVTASSLLSAAGGTFGTAAFTAAGAYDAAGSAAAAQAASQPLDADLTAIASLTTTSFGRGLLDDADAAAGRSALGVIIGTDVQAYDADLADLSDGSLTGSKVGSGISAANITTGTVDNARLDSVLQTYAALNPSSNVQTLLASANYAAIRGVLGISPSVISSGSATLVGGTVTVSHAAVTSSSRIVVTGNADGGTPGWLRVSARTASTSFTITSSSGTDTSTVAWILAEP